MTSTRSAVLGTYISLGTKEVHTLFVCPANSTTLVKSYGVLIQTSLTAVAQVFLVSAKTAAQCVIVSADLDLATKPFETAECWFVMEAADELRIYASAAHVNFWMSGAILIS